MSSLLKKLNPAKEQNECKNYVPSYINWGIMIIRFDFFTVAFCLIIHYFSFVNLNFRLNSVC